MRRQALWIPMCLALHWLGTARLIANEAPPFSLAPQEPLGRRHFEFLLGMQGVEGAYVRAHGRVMFAYRALRFEADWSGIDAAHFPGQEVDGTESSPLPMELGLSPGFVLGPFALAAPVAIRFDGAQGERTAGARFGAEASLTLGPFGLEARFPELVETDANAKPPLAFSAWFRWASPAFSDPYGEARITLATGFSAEPVMALRTAVFWSPTLRKSGNALAVGIDLSLPLDEPVQPLFGFSLRLAPRGPWRLTLSAREWVPRWWEWGVALAYASGSF
ncbi:MAG: hypothetical protein J0L75_19485 [Spirochaetes bacterium]|nr:hypothetical protein [Spirochaetota bacterium]